MPTRPKAPAGPVIRKPSGIMPHQQGPGPRAQGPDVRHFLAIPDFTRDELDALFDLAEQMRSGEYTNKPLA